MDEITHFFEHNFQIHDDNNPNESLNASSIVFTQLNQSNTNKATEKMLISIESFTTSIRKMDLKQSDTNMIFKLCGELLSGLNELNLQLIEDDNGMTAPQILEVTSEMVRNKIFQCDSSFKRNKVDVSNKFYVAPRDTAIGTRWELKKTKKNGKVFKIPRLIQSVFQYISILETLKALFSHDEFRKLYFDHNLHHRDHVCEPGKYRDYCCGSNFQNCELFQRFPESLQLQLGCDDFEVCNPLASKANRHKACPVYFTIQNLPQQFKSKVNNIYLTSLCNSDDVKTKQTDFNNIWQIVVNEISHLETHGIDIGSGLNLKGTLTQVAFDNLGANTSLGFVGSFSSNFYCRHCECSIGECQCMTRENTDKIRTKESYKAQIKIVDESEKVNFTETKGVKFYCQLSDLKYFDVIQNPTADIMHDICEGMIPFALKILFEFCINSHLLSLVELNWMVQFFDYGWLSRKNLPSEIKLKKRALGQNASQSLCLFRNLPFILFNYREKLSAIWPCIEPLLRVVEIVHSYEITENDLKIFEDMLASHLEELKKYDPTIKFIPKHHFSLHYPRIIRVNGSLIHMSMINYERKHKVLKDFATATRNFKNINKTVALKHQSAMCLNGFTYVDDITSGDWRQMTDDFVSEHGEILQNAFDEVTSVKQTTWLRVNNYEYRKDLLILHDSFLHSIVHVLFDGSRYFFLCCRLETLSFNKYFNSFKTKETHQYCLIEYSKLSNKKTYEVKLIESEKYVIAETLELRNHLMLSGQI